jgi:hypothetical protein
MAQPFEYAGARCKRLTCVPCCWNSDVGDALHDCRRSKTCMTQDGYRQTVGLTLPALQGPEGSKVFLFSSRDCTFFCNYSLLAKEQGPSCKRGWYDTPSVMNRHSLIMLLMLIANARCLFLLTLHLTDSSRCGHLSDSYTKDCKSYNHS